jgi:hypothetical protein
MGCFLQFSPGYFSNHLLARSYLMTSSYEIGYVVSRSCILSIVLHQFRFFLDVKYFQLSRSIIV